MAKMRVMVVKYGYAIVEAQTKEDALELTRNMKDTDFDWSKFDAEQVVEDNVNF